MNNSYTLVPFEDLDPGDEFLSLNDQPYIKIEPIQGIGEHKVKIVLNCIRLAKGDAFYAISTEMVQVSNLVLARINQRKAKLQSTTTGT